MSTRKKRKVRPVFKYTFFLIIALTVLLTVIRSETFKNAYHSYKLENIGYSEEEAAVLIQNPEVYELAKDNEYNADLAEVVADENFDVSNVLAYLDYLAKNNGAPVYDAVALVNKGIDYPYSNLLMAFVNEKYFLKTRLERYMEYADTSSDDTDIIVSKVNANRDYPYYTNTEPASKADQSLILVNKYYSLDRDFNPGLVSIPSEYAFYDDMTLNSVALSHFEELQKDAKKLGYSIFVLSAYRSYDDQEAIYNRYKAQSGQAYADKWSARPGYSEHQTGLVMDVVSYSNELGAFEDTNEYLWMKDNSYKYGFILRFPSGKEDITGYGAEPWHYRYVGVEAATAMYNEGLTLEEYYAYYVIQK